MSGRHFVIVLDRPTSLRRRELRCEVTQNLLTTSMSIIMKKLLDKQIFNASAFPRNIDSVIYNEIQINYDIFFISLIALLQVIIFKK